MCYLQNLYLQLRVKNFKKGNSMKPKSKKGVSMLITFVKIS